MAGFTDELLLLGDHILFFISDQKGVFFEKRGVQRQEKEVLETKE